MLEPFQKAAQLILDHQNHSVQVVSHMDADGVCSAAILSLALDRLRIEHRVRFVHMLYRDVVEELDSADLTIFTDLGSSQLQNLVEKFKGEEVIIVDHHEPERVESPPSFIRLNAYELGLDGLNEISGAGVAYLLAKRLNPSNQDLSALAVVGAVGDVQNIWGKLQGFNRTILQEAVEAGVLEHQRDLLLYGRHTRPLFKALESFTDPPIPGVTNSTAGCVTLLKDLNIPLKQGESWRRPVDLTEEEKQKLATELISRAYLHVPQELSRFVPGLIVGEVYTLLKEPERSPLRDADEFATCINSTARHEQPLIGFELAKGDRGVYYRAMLNLIKYHRRCIAEGMDFLAKQGLERGPKGLLQYFDATGVVKETFVGTLASLALGNPGCDPYKPVVGLVCNRGVARASARCSKLLFLKGLDLAKAIRGAAEAVGGEGGGHAVACGAQIPEEKVKDFLLEFERRVEPGLPKP